MIPQTYPSTLSANNHMQMVVFVLSDVSGLTRWIDYIPVKPPTTINTNFANTFAEQGYIVTNSLTSISGKQAWLDYIPVYIDYAATTPYSTNASGYIPMDVFQITSLFSAGEQGVWYDPSDFSTMFQDAAGTTPVTAVGQPVGRILDKSGRGNHATQATAASRPVLQQDGTGRYFLLFDGVDDWLQTASINFTSTDKITMFVGVRRITSVASGVIVELSVNRATNPGAFTVAADDTSRYQFNSSGSVGTEFCLSAFQASPNSAVLTGTNRIAGNVIQLRRNGVVESNGDALDQGTGNYGNYPLYIGRRGGTTQPFNGRLYSLIVRGAQSTATEINNAEAYVNSKTGAY